VAAIRFAPPLDDHNTARTAFFGAFLVPVTIQGQPGSKVGSGKSLSVEVSYDDGKTWKPASVHGTGNNWVALLQHPAGHGFVSLKAKAVSTSGSTVEQTILHSYKY
jgi:hypothetical protein